MKDYKIVFTDATTVLKGGLTLERFSSFGSTYIYDNTHSDELIERIKDADAVICNKTVISRDVISQCPNLKYIGLFATGYNNIDVDYASSKNIVVSNAGQYSTSSVAQYVFAYILNHACKVNDYNGEVKQGSWQNSDIFCGISAPTAELAGKTIGIIGYGSIGKQVARIAQAFDMNVVVHTRTKGIDGVKYLELSELLSCSDFVTVHCPLTTETDHMFNADKFAMFKKNAYFINTSRGAVVVEQALADALNNGILSGAAVDVLESEPMKNDCPLKSAKNITITPHIAWAPIETRIRLIDIVYDNLNGFLNGTPQNVVSH